MTTLQFKKIDQVVKDYERKLNVKFNSNKTNIGVGANILKSVSMASGKFIWIIGNDDIVLPQTISKLSKLLHKTNIFDFFVNSFDVHSNLILDKDMKFNLKILKKDFKKISLNESKKCKFF